MTKWALDSKSTTKLNTASFIILSVIHLSSYAHINHIRSYVADCILGLLKYVLFKGGK